MIAESSSFPTPPRAKEKPASLGRLAGWLCVMAGASLGVWAYAQQDRNFNGEASALLSALQKRGPDALAIPLLRLAASPRPVRIAFLQQALRTPGGPDLLLLHAQAFTVALTRIDHAETRALFRNALLPVMAAQNDPDALNAAAWFARRWDMGKDLSASETEAIVLSLLDRLLQRVATTKPDVMDPERIRALAASYEALTGRHAKPLPSPVASQVSRRLLNYIETDHNADAMTLLIPLMEPAEQNLAPAEADHLLALLADRIANDPNPHIPEVLAAAIRPLMLQVSAKQATVSVQLLGAQLILESDPDRAAAQVAAIGALSEKLLAQPQLSQSHPLLDIAQGLLARLQVWPDPELVTPLIQALRILTATPNDGPVEQMDVQKRMELLRDATQTITARLRESQDARDTAAWAGLLGTLQPGSARHPAGAAAEIESPLGASAYQLVERMENALKDSHDPYDVALLASALNTISSGIPDAVASRLAERVDVLLERESDPAIRLRLALALHAVSPGWNPAQAQAFAERMVEHMRSSHGPTSLRIDAFALHAVVDLASPQTLESAASILAERMTAPEATAMDLSEFVKGLRALGPAAGTQNLQAASAYLLELLRVETDPMAMGELAEILSMLGPSASSDKAIELLEDHLETERNTGAVNTLASAITKLSRPQAVFAAGSGGHLQHVFNAIEAPCRVALYMTGAERIRAIADQLRNPLCAQRDWEQLALEVNQTPVVQGVSEPALEVLAGLDDDDGASGDQEDTDLPVDFHRLSERLAPVAAGSGYRPSWAGIGLLLVGGVLLGKGLVGR